VKLPAFLNEGEFGEVRLTGHRIGLFHVIDAHNRGLSAEQLHDEFPSLPTELIRQVLAFAEANRAEVDAYVARCREQAEQDRRAGKTIDVEELKQRMIALGRMRPDGSWL
jgi:uncharacterized protein (DUF433 family)